MLDIMWFLIGIVFSLAIKSLNKWIEKKYPNRTWVGLTHQERNEIRGRYWLAMSDAVFDDIEANLKAKNFTSSEGFKEKNT